MTMSVSWGMRFFSEKLYDERAGFVPPQREMGVQDLYLNRVAERSGTYHLDFHTLYDSHIHEALPDIVVRIYAPYYPATAGEEIIHCHTLFHDTAVQCPNYRIR